MNDAIGGVDGGAGGPHDPGMEIRVAHLEEDVREIKTILRSMDTRMGSIEVGIADLRGRVQNLPSTWAMITTMLGGQVALAGLFAAAFFAALRFASH